MDDEREVVRTAEYCEGHELGMKFGSREELTGDFDAIAAPLNWIEQAMDAHADNNGDGSQEAAFQHAIGFLHGIGDAGRSRRY